MTYNKWTTEQKTRIIKLRDVEDKEFSKICSIMRLTQREARSLYACAKRTE